MQPDAILSLRSVSKRFGGLSVIQDVSFDVVRGEKLALIGPNGAGKSTLFNLLSGVYAIDAGEILLNGERIDHLPSRRRIAAGLSRSFQNIRLMPHLSVLENILLGEHSRLKGPADLLCPITPFFQSHSRQIAISELSAAGIDVDPDAPVSGLPYGIRKRIEVVRALRSQPDVLMLDEPAAGLNPRETKELAMFLKARAQKGLTLVVVEHDMSFVRNLCERTVVLNFGAVIYDGATDGVQGDAAVREAYLGTRREPAAGEHGRAA